METSKARATKTHSALRMACAVSTNIHAGPDKIWALLTDAPGFPRWNSTVTSIEGEIAEGRTLKLKLLEQIQR
ncbi:MAG TPA: SRPBCC family protein [Polyangiaceae bacterium]|nr:SRPBCC family protein [Polyangiaceae bacterium]